MTAFCSFCSEWDTCSDMLPFNLAIPIVTYSCFIVPLAITTYIPRDPQCYEHPGGTYYRVAITAIFTTFCTQVGTEICTLLFALRGKHSTKFHTGKALTFYIPSQVYHKKICLEASAGLLC